jgi:nicotinamide-nucleotide amidase
MKAEIITIGDEILIGQVVDSNSAWIAQQLNKIGVKVNRVTSISDNRDEITTCLDECIQRGQLVLLTGGLGPTNDDITKQTLNAYFGGNLTLHQPTLEHVAGFFKQRGMPLTEMNRQQALLPDNCVVLPNPIGTAPGMLFEKNGAYVVAMPGVPYEMKQLIENEVLPLIKKQFKLTNIFHRTLLTQGVAESVLAPKIKNWEDALPPQIKLAYLPSPGKVRLRLSAEGGQNDDLQSLVDTQVKSLINIIGDDVFGFDDDTLESIVGQLLTERGKTLSTAESCTGGAVAASITSVSGSSGYFKGSVVAYDNMVKVNTLKVKGQDILNFGAVSQEVIEQMALGAMELFNTDFAIATSGIAGPTGGTENKPVGTVWIAVASKDNVVCRKFLFGEHRGRNITRTVLASLNMLRKLLLEY